MGWFLLRLNGPRPTHPDDATPAERAAMAAHGDFWRAEAAAGRALIVASVLEGATPWGLAIVEAADAADAAARASADPVVDAAGNGFHYDILPLGDPILRAAVPGARSLP